MDGAGTFWRFRSVTLPLIAPSVRWWAAGLAVVEALAGLRSDSDRPRAVSLGAIQDVKISTISWLNEA